MPGAGSSTVAWASETSYLGGTGTPTYREPGTNVQVETAELSNNLLRILSAGDVEARTHLAQNLEGQLSVSWILKNDDYHRFIFNDGNTGWTSGQAESVEWYLGVDYLGGTSERQIKGWVPVTASVEYSGATDIVRVTATGPYGDEEHNTSITPGSISKAGDEVPGHGASFSIDGATVSKLQSAALQFTNISRLQLGTDRKPVDAVCGNVESSLQMAAIYEGSDKLELAYGSSGVSTPQDSVGSVSANLSFSAGGTTIADYSITRVAPDSYDWTDLVNNDDDLNESVEFQASGITGSAP